MNLWPSDAWPRLTPVSLWTGSLGVVADFRVWGNLTHVRAPSANKLFARTHACVFLGFTLDSSDWAFYDPVTYQFFSSQDVTFDESISYYKRHCHRGVSHVTPDSFPPQRPVPVVSWGAGDAAAEGGGAGAAALGGADSRGVGGVQIETNDVENTVVSAWWPRSASPPSFPYVTQFLPRLALRLVAAEPGGVPTGGTADAGGFVTGDIHTGGGPARLGTYTLVHGPLPSPPVPPVESLSSSSWTRRSPLNRAASLEPCQSRYHADGPFHLVLCSHVPPLPIVPQPAESSLTEFSDPLFDYPRASRPVILRVLSALVTHPSAPPLSVSALPTTVTRFASSHHLDYSAHLVNGPSRSLSSGGAAVFPLEAVCACVIARFVAPGRHRPPHWYAAKRVAKYVANTSGMGLVLGGKQLVALTGFSDSSWADNADYEAEAYAAAMASQELRRLFFLLTDLGEQPRSPVVLFADNKSAVLLCEDPRLVGKAKHIQLCYLLLRDFQQCGQAHVVRVVFEANTADIFTKTLPPCDHQPEKRNEPPPSKIKALDGSNYEEWSGWMRIALKCFKLLKLAMGEEKMPEEGYARDRWIKKSAVLYDLILQSVNNGMFQHIKDLVELDDSGPKAWKLLRDMIQPNTLPMVIVLEKELAALSMRLGNDVKPVLDKIKDTYTRLTAPGSNVSQMQQCTKIISVLDNSWDNLIPTLNTQQDQWTLEWLQQEVLQKDFRRRHMGGGAANKTAEGYGAAGGSRGRGGGRGRGRGRGFGRGRGRGDYNEGHGSSVFQRPEGWAPPGMKPPSGECKQGGIVQGSGAHSEVAQGKASPRMFLMVEDVKGSEGDVGSVGKVVMHPLTHWVIVSGCTIDMTPQADLLDEVKPPGKIKFVVAASGAFLPVMGVGNAKVMGADLGLVRLGNVLLVEGLSANLLSVRWLQKSKAKFTFSPTSCRAKLGKLLLWDREEKNSFIKGLWQLPIIPWNGKPPAMTAAATMARATAGEEEIAPTDEALDAVKKVQQPQQPHVEVLAGVKATAAWAKASSGSGELHLETKFTKFPFSNGTGPAKAPLALVHMDVVGPTRAFSLSGSRYFLTIVVDHTRAVWVYPLKTKGEVAASVLKEWMPRAQRESGHKMKVIRTENGGEFIGNEIEAMLKKKGIQHQLTVPYNPQQNGVAERFNWILQEGAHTLLGRAGLPDPFWVTAQRQVALVKNLALAIVGDKQWVPYTKWYGSAPAVNMLRAYGCMVVFHVPKEKRGKLEASGRWGVHLGNAKDHKGRLVWDLIGQKMIVLRDVKQVEVTVSEEEISGVTEDGGESEVEEEQQ
ncbi:unnamed protein product [Closterium sp. NIES-53]